MSSSAELKARLEAARVERERWEQETREQEEQELQRLMEEEERREEEERACREQQRAEEERRQAEEAEAERIAGEQRETVEMEGGERSKEMDTATWVTETMGESWEDEISRLQAAVRAGSSRDGEEEYQAMENTCRNCRHRKLACERPG